MVDDASSDGTGAIARAIGDPHLVVLDGQPRPTGWSGKLWAVAQGLAEAGPAELVLLADADIVHQPRHLATLVAQAERGDLDLVSEMVALACDIAGGARAGAGLRVTSSSCSTRSCLGERSAARDGGRGRRHDAAAPPGVGSHRRGGGGARGADRRRGVGRGGQAGRAHLAGPLRTGAVGAIVSGSRRHLAHGIAHRLCPVAFLAAGCWPRRCWRWR